VMMSAFDVVDVPTVDNRRVSGSKGGLPDDSSSASSSSPEYSSSSVTANVVAFFYAQHKFCCPKTVGF